jgi:hypothetical protein
MRLGQQTISIRQVFAISFANVFLALCAPVNGDQDGNGIEFFEKKVRPILSQHCYECHGAEKAESNLRLDQDGGWLAGGDSGPAVLPGKPETSLLIVAVKQGGESIDMPPDGKLSAEAIKVLEDWVRRGAPAPVFHGLPTRPKMDTEKLRSHWSYQPLKRTHPDVSHREAMNGRVDAYVLDRLLGARIPPEMRTDRVTLIRRLTFDLVGLPPSPDEIDEYLLDSSPTATERLIDRLLASPHFGERWGRHWLDVVRYAESLTLRGFIFPEAWRYRDYVIEQFNVDYPFDQFLREQLAGDLLSSTSISEKQRQIIATTFWALGNTNLEEQDKRQLDMDVVDEQIDVMGKAMLGQTIGCARCHDHKFDPIPASDYYALAGILRNTQMLEHANVSKWTEVPLPLSLDDDLKFASVEKKVKDLSASIATLEKRVAERDQTGKSSGKSKGMLAVDSLEGIIVDDTQAKKVGEWASSDSVKPFVGSGYLHDNASGKGEKTITFVPVLPSDGRYEVRLAYAPGTNRSAKVPVTIFSADGEKSVFIDMTKRPPLSHVFISLGEFKFEAAGQSFVLIANEGTDGHVVADAVQFIPREQLAITEVQKSSSPSHPKNDELVQLKEELKSQQKELKSFEAMLAARPRCMSIRERKEITESPIHLRGSVHTLGELVPRGFLQVVEPARESPLPANQSGRLELAEWITSPRNPLTSRVYVNRVWHWLIGEGLVRTVDNFGTTGEIPSHAELLDDLSLRFMEGEWSTKALIREIAESEVYQRCSSTRKSNPKDPENRLLAHAYRRRLDAESLRDAMLVSSGELNQDVGGSSIPPDLKADYGYISDSLRRSIYLPVFRNALPELFEVFDFPETSLVVGRRNSSTVAPQALFLMNSPFVDQRSKNAAMKLLNGGDTGARNRVNKAFRETLGRLPSKEESEWALKVVGLQESNPAKAWGDLYRLLFLSLDFRYLD